MQNIFLYLDEFEIFAASQVCKEWRELCYTTWKNTLKIIDTLYYDLSVYDKYSYSRNLIKLRLEPNRYKFYIPYLTTFCDDIFGENTQEITVGFKPLQLYNLINVYATYPNPCATLLPYEFITNIIRSHTKDLCEIIIDEEVISQLVYFTPLMTMIHHPTKWDDDSYTLVLCAANIIDVENPIFTDKNPSDSFVIFKLSKMGGGSSEIDLPFIAKHLFSVTDDLFGNDWSKVREIEFRPLTEAFRKFITMNDTF